MPTSAAINSNQPVHKSSHLKCEEQPVIVQLLIDVCLCGFAKIEENGGMSD